MLHLFLRLGAICVPKPGGYRSGELRPGCQQANQQAGIAQVLNDPLARWQDEGSVSGGSWHHEPLPEPRQSVNKVECPPFQSSFLFSGPPFHYNKVECPPFPSPARYCCPYNRHGRSAKAMHHAASGNKLHNWFTGAMQRRTQKKILSSPFHVPSR